MCCTLYRGMTILFDCWVVILASEDAASHTPSVYLSFPFFDSTPFREYLVDISATELTAYAKQLLSGLEFIHWGGIVHRDIKPSNVLFNRATLKLLVVDFGLARRCLQDPGIVHSAKDAHSSRGNSNSCNRYNTNGGGASHGCTFAGFAPQIYSYCLGGWRQTSTHCGRYLGRALVTFAFAY